MITIKMIPAILSRVARLATDLASDGIESLVGVGASAPVVVGGPTAAAVVAAVPASITAGVGVVVAAASAFSLAARYPSMA